MFTGSSNIFQKVHDTLDWAKVNYSCSMKLGYPGCLLCDTK